MPLATLAACTFEPGDAVWVDASEITGPLAVEARLEPARASAVPLRIVTYNVELGRDPQALARAFMAPPLDRAAAILVQEIEAHPDEAGSRARQIAAATGMAYVYAPARMAGGGTHGLAIFARRPLSVPRVMALPDHDTLIRDRRRIALAVVMEDLELVNVHLDLRLGIAERIAQLSPATRQLAPRVVIGGDLNTNPYAWVDVIPAGATEPIIDLNVAAIVDDAMIELGFAPATASSGPTQSSPAGRLRLDALYTRGVTPGAAGVHRALDLSDHWPVWLDVDGDGSEEGPGAASSASRLRR